MRAVSVEVPTSAKASGSGLATDAAEEEEQAALVGGADVVKNIAKVIDEQAAQVLHAPHAALHDTSPPTAASGGAVHVAPPQEAASGDGTDGEEEELQAKKAHDHDGRGDGHTTNPQASTPPDTRHDDGEVVVVESEPESGLNLHADVPAKPDDDVRDNVRDNADNSNVHVLAVSSPTDKAAADDVVAKVGSEGDAADREAHDQHVKHESDESADAGAHGAVDEVPPVFEVKQDVLLTNGKDSLKVEDADADAEAEADANAKANVKANVKEVHDDKDDDVHSVKGAADADERQMQDHVKDSDADVDEKEKVVEARDD